MNENDERRCEPETWRVKGLLLHQLALSRGGFGGQSDPLSKEAESCFIKAIELAHVLSPNRGNCAPQLPSLEDPGPIRTAPRGSRHFGSGPQIFHRGI
jgi:hypothetical protein